MDPFGCLVGFFGYNLFLDLLDQLWVDLLAGFYTLGPSAFLGVSPEFLGTGGAAGLRGYRWFAALAQAQVFAFLASKCWFLWR